MCKLLYGLDPFWAVNKLGQGSWLCHCGFYITHLLANCFALLSSDHCDMYTILTWILDERESLRRLVELSVTEVGEVDWLNTLDGHWSRWGRLWGRSPLVNCKIKGEVREETVWWSQVISNEEGGCRSGGQFVAQRRGTEFTMNKYSGKRWWRSAACSRCLSSETTLDVSRLDIFMSYKTLPKGMR